MSGNDELRRLGSVGIGFLQQGHLSFAGALEHKITQQQALVLPAADAYAHKVIAAQAGKDAPQTVMGARRALASYAQAPQGQLHIVYQHDKLFRGKLVKAHDLPQTAAAEIHIGLGLDEQHFFPLKKAFPHQSLKSSGVDPDPPAAGQSVQRHKADVVAGPAVAESGVSQTGDDIHGRSSYDL